jgi:guanylate kinase
LNKVIIFSAPSGSGKTTVVKHLLEVRSEKLGFSVSATTRKPRAGEVNGREYYFLSEEEFRSRIASGEFLEYEEVYQGILYGTLNSEVDRLWREGKAVLFDVDVVGGKKLKAKFAQNALSVFLRPPNMQVLMQRLRARSTEVEHQLEERLDKATTEMQFEKDYDVVVVNDKLEDTFRRCEQLTDDFLAQA